MKRITLTRIFVASPSNMSAERAKILSAAEVLRPLADNLQIALKVVDWRAVVPDMGRSEKIILDQLKPTSWDVFVGILWHRFGTPSGKEFQSGTEEEFSVAYRLWKRHGKPRIMMYRCNRPAPLDALDPNQFKRVKEFFAQFDALKGEHPGLYQSFDTTQGFERLLLDNLQRLLIEYGEQIRGKPVAPEVVQAFAPKIPNNLPRRAAFFGRAKEMDVVMRALTPADRTWGVLVDGIGGIGKTALAIEAAHRAQEADAFDAFVFITAKQNILEPSGIREKTPAARTLDDFLNETARVLGQPGIAKLTGNEKRRALLDALRVRSTRALLIYDNLETLSKEEQEAMADFLRELPQGCKAIITSRRRGGEGAVWLRVEKLDWDAARGIIENEMARDAGLANKLRRVGSRWRELYDETNGSPLALVHTLGLMRVRAALTFDGALAMLRGNRNADLQKFIFQEARKELTENDKTALGALSFFVPSATFEAWMQVAELSRNALETTIDRLSGLSLVDVLAGEERYALHPLTRAFVHDELLADANVARETGMRFARYWVDYAKRYGGDGKENFKTYDRVEAGWANLEVAGNWLWETASAQAESVGDKDAARMLNDLAVALCGTHGPLFFRGRWDESVRLSELAYKAIYPLNNWSQIGWRAYQVAWIFSTNARNEPQQFGVWAVLCSDAWDRGSSKSEQALATKTRGLVAVQSKAYVEAQRLYQEALAIWQELEDSYSVANVFIDLANLARMRKEHNEAEQYYHEALELAQENDLEEIRPSLADDLGLLALDREQWSEARKWFEQELPLAKAIGRVDSIAQAQYGLARVHEAEGRADLALPLAQDALKIYERLQHRDLAEARELVERLQRISSG